MQHVLWHNSDHTVILLDGPASIADAQGSGITQAGYRILSTPPLTRPFPSQEPKSDIAKQRLVESTGVSRLSDSYVEILQNALQEIKRSHDGRWAPARLDDKSMNQVNCREDVQLSNIDDSFAQQDLLEREGGFIHNHSDRPALLRLSDDTYLIPPRSSSMTIDCTNPRQIISFHQEVRHQASENDTPWKFDAMIIDPPWTNRSVRRKRRLYDTSNDAQLRRMLSRLDLDRLMTSDGLVAVWITNKTSAREIVLGEGGLFDVCGVDLIEEWIWLKVTKHGEPISVIDSLWRRPYEVLLVGRRRSSSDLSASGNDVVRRVLVSVPDVHSRKPCLQYLIRLVFGLPETYRGLEVFARYLVKNWWSIGIESTLYNNSIYWSKAPISTSDEDTKV